MFTLIFWKRAAERAVKSAAQATVGVLTLGGVASSTSVNAFLTDWKTVAGCALGMAVLSIGTSLASIDFGPTEDPSVVS